MKFYMEKSLNELKKNFIREYANMTSTKDVLDILEFHKNDNNQLREQVKDRHEILNGIVRVLQNLHQNKQNQSSMTPPNLSVNIDKNIATENFSEKSHGIFFNCYLAAPQPTLGHYRGGSLTHRMLITCVFTYSTRRSPRAS